ncbi:hypothetical protein RKD23_000982 [Streptomyces sp. SAI-170]|uniref:hypothetical protein n=1 Tax=Streptomyces sp. SAI-170 TaxID=3377729 RepID=UPI003C7DDE3D
MTVVCPTPHHEDERVLLGHGAGGRLTAELLDALVLPALGGPSDPMEDAALLPTRAVWSPSSTPQRPRTR